MLAQETMPARLQPGSDGRRFSFPIRLLLRCMVHNESCEHESAARIIFFWPEIRRDSPLGKVNGMGLYSRYVFPYAMDRLLSGPRFDEQRRLALAPARGKVLEIGFGTGLNFPHYPRQAVCVTAIDDRRMRTGLVNRRIATAGLPIATAYRDASEELPFADSIFDTVVTTWTLCSIQHAVPALREIRRVLKQDGVYLFLEHGCSDDPKVAHRQNLLGPIVQRIGSGCQMNRRIDELILLAGLKIVTLHRYRMAGVPLGLGEMYRGVAVAASTPPADR